MRNGIYFLLFLFCLMGFLPSYSQNFRPDSSTHKADFTTDTVPALLRKKKKTFIDTLYEKNSKKQAKKKKKVFYGMKCRKGFIKKGVGDKMTMEIFYYLKVYQDPNPYATEIYVFDIKKGAVAKVTAIDPKKKANYRILHGPYRKVAGGKVIEQGIFYVGTKHARWELFDKNFILMDKTKYYKGWPKDAKLSFYDGAQTKLKEVIPYEFDEMTGDYFFFKDNGKILIRGQYRNGKKAGLWIEYFPNLDKVMRETQYPKDPEAANKKEPYIHREFDLQGNLILEDGKKVDIKQKNDPRQKGKKKK